LAASVFIVILNWNGWQDTAACVESCLASDYPGYRIIVVDNGSTDDSVSHLKQKFPDLDIIENDANLGFGGGNNVGIGQALASGADYIWLLNNDTLVAPDSLSKLVYLAEGNAAIGMVGSKIFYYGHPQKIWYAGAYWTADGGNISYRGYDQEDAGLYDEPCEVDFITGCSMLAKAALIRQIGLMPEEFFLYWEDSSWSRTAVEHGWKLYYEPESRVWHKVSASVGDRSALQWYYYTRNHCLFVERHARGKLLRHIVNHQWYQLRKAWREQNMAAANGILAGLRDYLLRRFGMHTP
jgi:GT2 family glycosyltransferase